MQQELAVMIPIVALCIPIVAIILDYFHKKNKMKLFEKAVEKGVPLEGLVLDEKKQRFPYRSGMIVLAIGIGTAIFGLFIGQMDKEALYPLIGIGAVLLLIGIALLVNDKMNYERYFNQQEEKKRIGQ